MNILTRMPEERGLKMPGHGRHKKVSLKSSFGIIRMKIVTPAWYLAINWAPKFIKSQVIPHENHAHPSLRYQNPAS
jgi:hypothetical protein